jgi:8-oxo-dGTP pyrophosphatase MutT (NUDIX family)
MTAKFRDEGEMIVPGPSVRPRDAASLILLKREGDEVCVLMGKRHQRHAFMPNKFVFPGGRVDPGDARVPAANDLPARARKKLLKSPINEARARALAMAAVRETFEEAGVIIGQPTDQAPQSRSPHWRPFFETGHLPELAPLQYVFRAITPPQRPRRFDTRFFMLYEHETAARTPEALLGSGELQELAWIPLTRTHEVDLPSITEAVLAEVRARVTDPDPDRPVPFIRFTNGKPNLEAH